MCHLFVTIVMKSLAINVAQSDTAQVATVTFAGIASSINNAIFATAIFAMNLHTRMSVTQVAAMSVSDDDAIIVVLLKHANASNVGSQSVQIVSRS